jgi:hypothetical protein
MIAPPRREVLPMKRLFVAVILIFASSVAQAQQITERYFQEGSLLEEVGKTTLRQRPDPGSVIIELDAHPLLGRDSKVRSLAAVELDTMLDRLENDIHTIENDRAGSISIRGASASPMIRHRYTRVFAGASATVSPESVERIRQLEYVRAVHPDHIVTALLHASVDEIGAPRVWEDHGVRGEGVVVAIIDTGVDYMHPALGGGIGAGYKVLGGRDFVNDDDDPMDDHGHGTHVAGIVAANGGGLLGVAPEASLLAFKVLDERGSGRDSGVLAAIEASVDRGAGVVNMSLGRHATANDPVIRAVDNASAAGIVFCVAAGNSGRFFDIGSPARALSAVTVGAIDRNGAIASFSSKGPVIPGASIKPEIVAPGVGIVSSLPGGGSEAFSGTSMAAPHAAGVVALLRSMHPEWSVERIRSALVSGARPTGAEVMAGGAGALYAPDAALANLFATPSEMSFGLPNRGVAVHTRVLFLTNGSAEVRPVSLEIEGLREGIELRASEMQFEIEPRETKRIDLSTLLWLGPHKEQRWYDARHTRMVLFDGEQRVVASREPAPPTGNRPVILTAEVPVPGSYRLEAYTNSFVVASLPAEGTISSTFDTRLEDSSPPVMTSLRLEDGSGRTSAAFSKGSAAAVYFSAVDLKDFGYGEIASEKTRIEYRPHSGGEEGSREPWTVVTAVEVGNDLEEIPEMPVAGRDGILYRVDLSGVTSTLSGPIDLRISIEDPSGNTTVYTVEPALVIFSGRRPAVSRR